MQWAVDCVHPNTTSATDRRAEGAGEREPRMSVQERDPCPHRIFDDIGGAFAMFRAALPLLNPSRSLPPLLLHSMGVIPWILPPFSQPRPLPAVSAINIGGENLGPVHAYFVQTPVGQHESIKRRSGPSVALALYLPR